MMHQFKKLNFWIVFLSDILFLIGAHYLAYMIRFEGQVDMSQWMNIKTVLPGFIILKFSIFCFCGLYRGMWRYTGITDLINVLKATVISSSIMVVAIVAMNRFQGFSRSVFVLDGLLTFIFIAGNRLAFRLYYQRKSNLGFALNHPSVQNRRKKLLIIGAGDAAEKVVREIKDNRSLPYNVVGFMDDNFVKIGNMIHGIPVLAPIAELHEIIAKTGPQEILIAIPSATRDQINTIVDLCRTSGVPFKTVPGMGEIINDKVSIKSIRDVSYKDLLGRPPARLELEKIEEILAEQTILITGAGGSIGSELCRQILRFRPGQIILLDASEQNLYQIEMEILHEHGFDNYITILGKVQDNDLLVDIFRHYKPAVVFHAAAYKHVPMVEKNPWEAIYNNVFATRRLMRVSVEHGADRFILVSTDKAVRPTNVMGATKRLTEKIMLAYCKSKISTHRPNGTKRTKFMAVRFGNVLGSSGSVIPLFRRQIELGGPVTVTDPEITRYFMSIEEAAQLILQAATMGEGGEIFILKMGTPVRIAQMARDLIKLCGKEPDTEIEIKYTGLRAGEKLYEELITEGEGIVSTEHEKIMVLKGNDCSMDEIRPLLEKFKSYAKIHDAENIKLVLTKAVPEYTPTKDKAIFSEKNDHSNIIHISQIALSK